MKTRLLFLVISLLTTCMVSAQKKMDAQKMAQYQNQVMSEELNLNEEQQIQIEELNFKYSKKQADLMNSEGSMFGKMGDMKKIRKEKTEELEKILTKEQMTKFEDDVEPKMRKEMRKKMSEE